jgi:hypothetical protein
MTMLEVLIAISIIVMIVGSMGALASAVQSSADYSSSCATATEHARVTLDRIERMVEGAFANEKFPGFIVLEDEDAVGSYHYPDTLVVWDRDRVKTDPPRKPLNDPTRLPYHDELVVFCPDPNAPNRLVEITSRCTTSLGSNPDNWATEIGLFKSSMVVLDAAILNGDGVAEADYEARTLTELLRSCAASDGARTTRGAIRFESRLRPSDAEWKNKSLNWSDLSWVQGVFGPMTGLRQAWLRIELQLVPPVAAGDTAAMTQAVPFFGSAAVYYPMRASER